MVIGIDLGTTYSVGAYVKDDGEVEIISNDDDYGSRLTPSVVLFDDKDGIIVGSNAKQRAILQPDDVIIAVKNEMGKKKVLKKFHGVEYNPEMISSFIIKKIVKDAEEYLGQTVDGVVITVPAYFNDAKRKATEDAARLAGVKLVGMINEPTAAALCYVKKHNIQDQKLLIYDLGGGTFDVTLLYVKDSDHMEVISTGGLSNTGGHFFDEKIVDYVCDYINEKYDVDMTNEEYEDEYQDLMLKAEKAKIQLSQKTKADIPIRIGNIRESVEITREWFESEKVLGRVYTRTESKIRAVLDDADISEKDVDSVLLVGGSSRIPYIMNRVQSFVGKKPSKEINPSEAVAIGAALYSKFKEDSKVFSDVCSHSIGVVAFDREKLKKINQIIIPRNSQIPVMKNRIFKTAVENQLKLELTVTEGEYEELSDVSIIGSFEICFPDNTEKGTPIVVSIALDENQIISIKLELKGMNFEHECHLKRQANMGEDELDDMSELLRNVMVS